MSSPRLILCLLAGVCGAWLTALGASSGAMIDSGAYPNSAAAAAAWRPMGGSANPESVVLEGQRVLRLPCNFKGTTIERASWDIKVNLDLRAARGVQFQVRCRDTSPVSHFSLYFQSGAGWYHHVFYPEKSGEWTTITIDKADAGSEGEPAGWGQVRTIRLSAWRGNDEDTEFYLRDLRQYGVLGEDAAVAVVLGEYAMQRAPGEARSIEQTAEAMAQQLRAAQVECVLVPDTSLTPELLHHARLVILPYNPVLPESATEALSKYYEQGGKLLLFYNVPANLRTLLKLEPGTHLKAERDGGFASIRFAEGALPGAPAQVQQRSWNITAHRPAPGAGRVLAEWYDDQGKSTGQPAIVGSTRWMLMTHILLNDDAVNKRRMLLAMAAALAPDVGRQAAEKAIAALGQIGGFKSYDEAVRRLGEQAAGKPQAQTALDAARKSRDAARDLVAKNDFAGALDACARAEEQLTETFCRVQDPLPGEFRAFWCHSAFGVQGMTWDEAARRLAENGFTAVLPNMLWGGVAFYESQLLPVAAAVTNQGDQIRLCLDACRKHGLQVHVWKVNWNLGHAAPKWVVEKMRGEGRLQRDNAGKEEPWLCPSHPLNQQLEIDSMVEVARNYAVDGIHFDYIRYPNSDHCFCEGCKERFQKAAGVTLKQWPADVRDGGAFVKPWLEWRRGNITRVVKDVSEKARAVRPGIKISAAVFRNWPADRDNIGQDWKVWCDLGYLDFVCPMNYTPLNAQFENMVVQQLGWTGRVPCYPGIGLSASSSRFGVDRLIEQIHITRRHKTGGFVVFNYGVRESRDILPHLGLGITARSP